MSLSVAAIQMTSGDKKRENLKKAGLLLEKGVDLGANLLALPENFSFMGKEGEKRREAEQIDDGESVNFLREFAAKYNVWLLGGTVPIKAEEGKIYNTSLLINDEGDIAARYDKIHLFDVDIPGGESHKESEMVKGGREVVSIETAYGIVGLSVCYDLRFPELYRRLTEQGARVIFVPAAFTKQTGEAHWEVLLRARAIENQVFVAAPAQVGIHSEKRQTYGNSMIIDPWGKVLARADNEETVITAKIDFSYQDEVRKSIPCLRHKMTDY